jgi:hypothetical protein
MIMGMVGGCTSMGKRPVKMEESMVVACGGMKEKKEKMKRPGSERKQ